MKINEIINEGSDAAYAESNKDMSGTPHKGDATMDPMLHDASTGSTRFRDKGGYDRTYHLHRIMMAAAVADGKSTKAVNVPQSSWVEKYNVATPYTEEEHNMMQSALNTIDSDYQQTDKDHKSRESSDVYKVSPHPNPGPIKHRSN